MLKSNKKIAGPFFRSKAVCFALAVALLGAGYYFFAQRVTAMNYAIFDLTQTVSWLEIKDGIFRRDSKQMLDNFLLSRDSWKEYEVRFKVLNPIDCGIVYHYKGEDQYSFIYFNQQKRIILSGTKKNKEISEIKPIMAPIPDMLDCVLTIGKGQARLNVNGTDYPPFVSDLSSGRIGLVINRSLARPTVFNSLTVSGTLANGSRITGRSPPRVTRSAGAYVLSMLPLMLCLFGAGYLFCRLFDSKGKEEDAFEDDKTKSFWPAILIHLLLASIILFPMFQGEILISSYDNLGEIYPLFFHSKHNFEQFLNGQPLSLWNPYVHNGVPQYNNHWNMIYYPLNWPLFLMPDRWLLRAMTVKTFLEIFLAGVFAFGFFCWEFPSRKWALFSSVAFQLCSIMIFCCTVYPSTALYFSMILFLYLMWSSPARAPGVNYLYLTLAFVMLMTSANMAFVFYAFVSVAVIALYRVLGAKDKAALNLRVMGASVVTGSLIAAVRMLPCLWGVSGSNRLVANYGTLHDRLPMVIRLFLPDIAGRYGTNLFNALVQPNLKLIFFSANLPSNPQNTFFVYFGVLSALLMLAAFFLRSCEKVRFWLFYSWIGIAIALLVQPFWGLLSILFFPYNHFSYHAVILPVGICALVGHAGCALENKATDLKKIARSLVPFLVVLQLYILVFVTYLFPQLTPISRLICLLTAVVGGVCFLLRKGSRRILHNIQFALAVLANMLLWFVLLAVAVAAILRPVPFKEDVLARVTLPVLFLLATLLAAMFYDFVARTFPARRKILLGLLLTVPLLSGTLVASDLFQQFLQFRGGEGTYALELVLGHLKVYFLLQLGVLIFAFKKSDRISRRMAVNLLIALLMLDLVAFNYRYDNITAPFTYNKPFFKKETAFFDVEKTVKNRMDLVNYRVSRLDQTGLIANHNLVFNIPSYTGTIGYMPKRFFDFIVNFGFSPRTIMIYPGDMPSNERMLDLSAVRYNFLSEKDFEIRPSVLSRMNLFYDYDVVPNDGELLSRLRSEEHDFTKAVLLAQAPSIPVPRQKGRAFEPVPVVQPRTDEVMADVSLNAPGLLLFNESFDPGWTAAVDGKVQKILNANHNFMALSLPPGRHTIRFLYAPRSYAVAVRVAQFGFFLFAAGLLFFLIGGSGKKPSSSSQ